MSKQLGNSPDPLDLIDKYGADGVRTGMLFSSPAGNDLPFDEKLCEQGRNFNNKIWNAFRLVKGWEVDSKQNNEDNKVAIDWFESRFNQALTEIEDYFSKYRISDALLTLYKLIWDDFCAWYLEMIKPVYQQPIDRITYEATIGFFERLMKIAHPFMPFITEEIWHEIRERAQRDCIIVAPWPTVKPADEAILSSMQNAFEVVTQIRNIRNSKGISPKTALTLAIKTDTKDSYVKFSTVIQKLANVSAINFVQKKLEGSAGFIIKGDELYVPLEEEIDIEKEISTVEKELEYTIGFRDSVQKKLSNERFISNAPEKVLALERQKLTDAEVKIKLLQETLSRVKSMR
jgi:valyl-tRNA synthetase